MRSSDKGGKNQEETPVKDIKKFLTDSSRVIEKNNHQRKQNVMLEMVNVLLSRDLVNTALAGEQVFAGSVDSPRLKALSQQEDDGHYLSYLYSAKFDPVSALPRNAERMRGWLEQAFAGKNKTVNMWIESLRGVNKRELSNEDMENIRKAVVFYCSARHVENEYQIEDVALSKKLADLITDIPGESEIANDITKTYQVLQQSEFIVQHGALVDKIDIINLVLDHVDRVENQRVKNEKQDSLPSPVIRLLIQHINRLFNELNPSGAFSKLFQGRRNENLINQIHLLTGMLEQRDANHLLSYYESNKPAIEMLPKELKLAVTKAIEFVAAANQQDASKPENRGSPRKNI